MNRITISVTPEIEAAIKREARRQGCSVSAVARHALGDHLNFAVNPDSRREIPFAAIGASGKPGIADRVEEVLDKEWGDPEFYRSS